METQLQQDNQFNATPLIEAGINLSTVFNLSDLPEALYLQVEAAANNLSKPKQLLLFAHAGNRFWRKLQSSRFEINSTSNSASTPASNQHPIDDYSIEKVTQHLKRFYPNLNFQILYPSGRDFNQPIGLQQFGELAGWHHNSPLKIGINQAWGTWFAYRVLLVCDGEFKPIERLRSKSPCNSCSDKPCISECPANAVSQTDFDLNCCSQYRASEQSHCRDRCVARLACPVAPEQRYPIEQIQYHYGRSMQIIQQMLHLKGKL
jgi:epoxyqueuosine reductase